MKAFGKTLVYAMLAVPLQKSNWQEFKYDRIPANEVRQAGPILRIEVLASSSPLIYKFPNLLKVKSLHARVEVDGNLNVSALSQTWLEDSCFRLGLIVVGDHRLSWLQRQLAPDWLTKLFALAPPHTGLDQVYFYNVGQAPEKVGMNRNHPKYPLLHEDIVALKAPGESSVLLDVDLKNPRLSVGLWMSSDGDDTRSSFSVLVRKIDLEVTESMGEVGLGP